MANLEKIYAGIAFQGRDLSFYLCCSKEIGLQLRNNNYIYEPEVISAILHFVKDGDVCIDAGANLGYHSLLMAQCVGQRGEVYAFEPDPACMDKLTNNINLNGFINICPLPIALWSGVRRLNFYLTDNDFCGYSSVVKYCNIETEKTQVVTIALDDLMLPDAAIRLIKIDCEGSEEAILHGAERILRKGVDAVIVEFNFIMLEAMHSGDAAIREYMEGLGYDFFYLHHSNRPPTYIPPGTTIQMKDGWWHFNGLFSKRKLVENWLCGDEQKIPNNTELEQTL